MKPVVYNELIRPASKDAAELAKKRWDSIAKPLGSLGLLEEGIIKIAALTGDANVSLDKRAAVVMCADNGVVKNNGVTQTDQSTTALVAGNIAKGDASVCRMSSRIGVDVFPIDVGMAYDAPGVIERSVMRGTRDMTLSPAMTEEEAMRAIDVGVEFVRELSGKDYKIITAGEMGIGNTTTSSALASVFLDIPVPLATGRGAGLTDAGLERKINAIERAIAFNKPDKSEPLSALAKVGGLDIAAMAGLFIGGAIYKVPVIIDGFISSVAALAASRICPGCTVAMLASHSSEERAAALVLDSLGLKPLIYAGLRLGEGTGALCALSLYDMALSVYQEMTTFDKIGLEAYK